MPSHFYIPLREPPSMGERAMAHAVEVTVAAMSVLLGIMVGVYATSIENLVYSPLGYLPLPIIFTLAAFVTVGGLLALVGLLVRRKNVRRELNYEQCGWSLMGIGWVAYAFVSVYLLDGASMSSFLAGSLAFGSFWRVYALNRIERALDRIEEASP